MKYYKDLCGIMLKTRGARFIAASTLETKERFSVGTMAFLSTYLMAVAVWQIAIPGLFDDKTTQIYGAISVVASVSLLVLTLLDFAYGRSVKSEKLHQNAIKISMLMRQLERELQKPSPDVLNMQNLAAEYEKEIAETQINHTEADYQKHLLQRADRSTGWNRVLNDVKLRWLTFSDYAKSLWAHVTIVLLVIGLTYWNMPGG